MSDSSFGLLVFGHKFDVHFILEEICAFHPRRSVRISPSKKVAHFTKRHPGRGTVKLLDFGCDFYPLLTGTSSIKCVCVCVLCMCCGRMRDLCCGRMCDLWRGRMRDVCCGVGVCVRHYPDRTWF